AVAQRRRHRRRRDRRLNAVSDETITERPADGDPASGVDSVDDGATDNDSVTDAMPDAATLLAERDEYKDIALRLQADFENYRKRVSADIAGEVERSTGRLVEALLPVLDACEAAFAHGADGVEPIWSSLIGTLAKQGLVALDLQGKPFDPAVAEAVLHEEGDGGDPIVAEVLRTGYEWKGRVLRAAMVKVRG
ncbi:MAG: nucleotide exchange factor GrpE, partial [Actinomycetota bacterium]